MMLSENEWHALLQAIRRGLEEIVTGSGYGQVTIECAASTPRDVRVQHSLRFGRDICPDEEILPQASLT